MRRRRSAAWLSALALAAPLALIQAGGASAADGDRDPDAFEAVPDAVSLENRVDGDKAATSGLAESDRGLLRRTDSRPVRVMIKLDYDSTATYQGGVDGLAATSPSVTGKSLTGRSASERAYERYVGEQENALKGAIRDVAPAVEFGQSLRRVYGGVSALLPANRAKAVAGIDGVVAVQRDSLNQLLTDSSTDFVNAPPAYTALGGTQDAGEGVIYGNLDSGVWPEHPSFADEGNLSAPPGPARECNFGDNPLTPANDPFVCQDKLIGGAPFLDTYLSSPARAAAEPFHTARDSNGHGTHTSSTSAGNIVEDVSILGGDLPTIHGMAPGAWVMEYKVCGIDGCFGSDSAAAVGQAIVDGVDVINFSISGGTQPFSDPVELAFLDAYAAGVFVSASAGNDGPGAGTANHLSPWTTTVGASTQTREFATTIDVTAGNGDTFQVDGASVTPGAGPLPIVLSSEAPYSNALCNAPAAPGTFTGKIVACQRGGNARVQKGYNVLQGGAAGMVLYNLPPTTDVETDTHYLPTAHVANGTDLVAFLNGHTGETASFAAGAARDGQGDVMASFSSRGPAGEFIKPDVTAPGVQILAGDTPIEEVAGESGPAGETFQAIAGTSMSSPHVAGAGILLRAVHPTWTPGQIRSALMTTSITDVLKEDGSTPADPFDMGAGRIDVGESVGPQLLFDETAANFAALGNDPVNAVHLNLPSINVPVMPGRLVTTRTAVSTNPKTTRYTFTAEAPSGSTITVSPRTANLKRGKSVRLTITIESDAPIDAQQFGQINMTSGQGEQHLPVAFVHTPGEVSLTQSCTPTSVPLDALTECTVEAVNSSGEAQTVTMDSRLPQPFTVTQVTDATMVRARHVRAGAVTLTGAAPGVPAVGPPGGGFLDLAAFFGPVPIGDEEILNYNVPAFEYAGETWTQLGVDSNGYAIVGGGASEDNNCCALPGGTDPARPNNILAPFWTDLDGTAAPGIRIGILTDGVSDWLVLQYEVNVFGTTDLRKFQMWIGLNGAEDVTYEYAANQADPAGQDFLVGAENKLGLGDMEAVLPTTAGLRVTSSAPTPGGSRTYSFKARGVAVGTGDLVTEMRASRVPGVTIAKTGLQVTGAVP
jgi:hypothetical protein